MPSDQPPPSPAEAMREAAAKDEAIALAERAGIDMMDDHDLFIEDLTATLLKFALPPHARTRASASGDMSPMEQIVHDAFVMICDYHQRLDNALEIPGYVTDRERLDQMRAKTDEISMRWAKIRTPRSIWDKSSSERNRDALDPVPLSPSERDKALGAMKVLQEVSQALSDMPNRFADCADTIQYNRPYNVVGFMRASATRYRAELAKLTAAIAALEGK